VPSCAAVQAWPHVSEVVPSVKVVRVVVRFELVLPAVQLLPPSHDRRTQNRGDLLARFTRPRSWTWMPRIVLPSVPKAWPLVTSLSRLALGQVVLFAVPLLASVASVPFGAPTMFALLVS